MNRQQRIIAAYIHNPSPTPLDLNKLAILKRNPRKVSPLQIHMFNDPNHLYLDFTKPPQCCLKRQRES